MTNSKGIPDFSKIKEIVSFEDLLNYGLLEKLKRKGDQLTGSCPIHQGEGKSCFSVNLQKGFFNFFSCKGPWEHSGFCGCNGRGRNLKYI